MNEDNYSETVKPKKIRKLFSPQEDALLTKIMFQQPFETWIAVAEQLPGRTARQCRDRWVNYLSPSNKNGPWSHEEDQLLAEKYIEHGPQWTTIAKFFDGRSENNVKNRWYTYVKARFNQSQKQHFTAIKQSKTEKNQLQYQQRPVKVVSTTAPPENYEPIQKPILPPISTFDNGLPTASPISRLVFPNAPRFRSESVQPFMFQ